MKRLCFFLFLLLLFSFNVCAENTIQEELFEELELEKAEEIIPDSVLESEHIDKEFSPTKTPSENGLNFSDILKYIFNLVFDSFSEELKFIFTALALLLIVSLTDSLVNAMGKGYLIDAVHFCSAGVFASLFIVHIKNALLCAGEYIEELSVFITGLMPFVTSVSMVGGEFSSAAVQKALILSAVAILDTILISVAFPISKAVLSFSVVGYISKLSLGSISEFLTSVTTKLITITFGIMCAVIYFQNTVSAVADSLALRSVKLAAGSFITIVGGFVSEASATLIAGVRLLKSTLGVFAIAVLIYMTAIPIVNFSIRKLSLKFLCAICKLLNKNSEAKVLGEMVGVYNILSAIMVASSCFFIFAISVFIKREVG